MSGPAEAAFSVGLSSGCEGKRPSAYQTATTHHRSESKPRKPRRHWKQARVTPSCLRTASKSKKNSSLLPTTARNCVLLSEAPCLPNAAPLFFLCLPFPFFYFKLCLPTKKGTEYAYKHKEDKEKLFRHRPASTTTGSTVAGVS